MYSIFLSHVFSLLGLMKKNLMSVMESFMEIGDLSLDSYAAPMGQLLFNNVDDFGLQDEWIVEESLDLFLTSGTTVTADNCVDECIEEKVQPWNIFACDDSVKECMNDFQVYDDDSGLKVEQGFEFDEFDFTDAEEVLDVLAKINNSSDKSSLESFVDDCKPPVLKPEEIDSLLSSPTSPEDSLDDGLLSSFSGDSSGEGETTRDEPPSPQHDQDVTCKKVYLERKQRKKEQNKSAASRYRQRKRGERSLLQDEYDILERRNRELQDKVVDIAREIRYWKGLMSEISKKSGGIKSL